MSGGVKWIPPLPPGWEGRYDTKQKAYFFINHTDKTTQWHDPRFPAAPVNPQATAATAASLLASSHIQKKEREAIPLKDLRSHLLIKASNNNVRKGNSSTQASNLNVGKGGSSTQRGTSNIHETSLTNEALIVKLHKEFPTATKEMIGDILNQCHNSEKETREQLVQVGFLSSTAEPGSAHISPQKQSSSGGHTGSSHTSPQKQSGSSTRTGSSSHTSPRVVGFAQKQGGSTGLSPHKKKGKKKSKPSTEEALQRLSTPPAKPANSNLSEADKNRIFSQAENLYPDIDPYVLRMALDHYKYNLEEAKVLVSSWGRKLGDNKSKVQESVTASTGKISAPFIRLFTPAMESLEPAGLEDVAAHRPQDLPTTNQNHQQVQQPTSNKLSTTGKATAAIIGLETRTKTATTPSCTQTARAKQVTRPAQADTASHPPVTSQPQQLDAEQQSKTTSLHRTEVKGPDARLRKGPDSSLLLSDYAHAIGPDKSLYTGPDKSRHLGPQGAQGPDLTLRCGPQSSLLRENTNNNYAHYTLQTQT